MSCSLKNKRIRWQAILDRLNAQYDKLNTAILALTTEIDSYKLETGEGAQSVKYKKLDDMMNTQNNLLAQIDRYERLICGSGIRRISLRRQL